MTDFKSGAHHGGVREFTATEVSLLDDYSRLSDEEPLNTHQTRALAAFIAADSGSDSD
jgi:hypothetical protein